MLRAWRQLSYKTPKYIRTYSKLSQAISALFQQLQKSKINEINKEMLRNLPTELDITNKRNIINAFFTMFETNVSPNETTYEILIQHFVRREDYLSVLKVLNVMLDDNTTNLDIFQYIQKIIAEYENKELDPQMCKLMIDLLAKMANAETSEDEQIIQSVKKVLYSEHTTSAVRDVVFAIFQDYKTPSELMEGIKFLHDKLEQPVEIPNEQIPVKSNKNQKINATKTSVDQLILNTLDKIVDKNTNVKTHTVEKHPNVKTKTKEKLKSARLSVNLQIIKPTESFEKNINMSNYRMEPKNKPNRNIFDIIHPKPEKSMNPQTTFDSTKHKEDNPTETNQDSLFSQVLNIMQKDSQQHSKHSRKSASQRKTKFRD